MTRNLLLDIEKLTVQSGAGRLRDFSLRAGRGLLFLVHSEDHWKVTSLFKVLAGHETPLEGDISYRGNGIGLVLAEDELPAWSKIKYELELYAKLSGLPREAMESLMVTWNLEGIYELPASALSSYERKAFFLVLETAAKPDLLICQEPLEGLNPRQQRRVLSNLRQYADQGRIVILGSVDPGQYPRSIPRVSLDRTGQQYHESDLAFRSEAEAGSPGEARDNGKGENVQAEQPVQQPSAAPRPRSDEATGRETPVSIKSHPEVPDSERVSRAYRGSGLPRSEGNVQGLPRLSRPEPDPSRLLSSSGSFGGRRLLTIFIGLPVSEETEYQLRRIAEIKYFHAAENGYEVDILEEEQSRLPELLREKGLQPGQDSGFQGRDEA